MCANWGNFSWVDLLVRMLEGHIGMRESGVYSWGSRSENLFQRTDEHWLWTGCEFTLFLKPLLSLFLNAPPFTWCLPTMRKNNFIRKTECRVWRIYEQIVCKSIFIEIKVEGNLDNYSRITRSDVVNGPKHWFLVIGCVTVSWYNLQSVVVYGYYFILYLWENIPNSNETFNRWPSTFSVWCWLKVFPAAPPTCTH